MPFARQYVAELLESRTLLAGQMITDLNPVTPDSQPINTVVVGDRAFFELEPTTTGNQLWTTDGTAEGTQEVWSTGFGFSAPTPGEDRVYFLHQNAMWTHDGTPGTLPVALTGSLNQLPQQMFTRGNELYFFARSGSSGPYQLYRSDGTPGGTGVVTEMPTGHSPMQYDGVLNGYENTRPVISSSGLLYFLTISSQSTYTHLWRSDGTSAGTYAVATFTGSSLGSQRVQWPTDVNGTLFFKVTDSASNSSLWKSDGTVAGTALVRNNIGQTSGEFVNLNGTLYFRAAQSGYGYELWKSNGTSVTTQLVKDMVVGSGSSNFGSATVANGLIYFASGGSSSGSDLSGPQLWTSDGTAAGTVQVTTLTGAISNFTVAAGGDDHEGYVFFSSFSQLYRTDGTPEGTINVHPPEAAFLYRAPSGAVLRGAPFFAGLSAGLLFVADHPVHGVEMYRATGDPGGSDLLIDLTPHSYGSNPMAFVDYDGQAYFGAQDGWSSSGLFRTDGTAQGTERVKDGIYGIAYPTVVNDVLYFQASDGRGRAQELFRSDGTEVGTYFVKDLDTFTTGGGQVSWLTEVNDTLVFLARPYPSGWQVWTSDGTADGTVRLSTASVWDDSDALPVPLMKAGNLVYFVADTAGLGYELWRSDGTAAGTMMVKDIWTGASSSSPKLLGELGGRVYFLANDGTGPGFQLFSSDGSDVGTVKVSTVPLGSFSQYYFAARMGNALYFPGGYSTGQQGLWKTDGTADGTVQVLSLPSLPDGLAVSGNRLFIHDRVSFSPNRSDLWVTDGTTAGSVRLREFQSIWNLTPFDGRLFFTAQDPAYGSEVWTSDGTEAGTKLVHDANPGPDPMFTTGTIGAAGGMLLYAAETPEHGLEPWRWVADPDSAPTVTDVFVSGSSWTQGFRDFVQSSGQGDSTYGFRLNTADHANELPWTNVNQISVRFSEDVNVSGDDLNVYGIRTGTHPMAVTNDFTYDPVTFTATWTLAASIAADKLLLDLDADAGGVTDASGNALDGEWTNPTAPANGGADSFPSGDGIAGGDFLFRLNVLPGDVNRSGGSILGSDVTLTRNAQNSTPGAPNSLYTIFKDVNGSGSILGSDVTLVRNRQGSTLPAGEPVPPAPTAVAETTSVTDTRKGTINRSSPFATGPKVRSAMRLLAGRFDLLGDVVEEPLVG